jgi:transposase-like protein
MESKGKTAQSKQMQQAVRMYKAGVPVEEIRVKLRIGYSRLFETIHASGVPMRNGGPNRETDPKTLKQVVEMYQDGERIGTIIHDLGITGHTVYKALDEAGVPRRQRTGNKKETPRSENKRLKRAKRQKQTTTNIVMMQHSFGEDFVGLANKVLAGELAFQI